MSVRRLSGPSASWQCPCCQTIMKKSQLQGAVGIVRCSSCSTSISLRDVSAGKYDVPEIELDCPNCSMLLRGAEPELLGHPCPTCGGPLPLA